MTMAHKKHHKGGHSENHRHTHQGGHLHTPHAMGPHKKHGKGHQSNTVPKDMESYCGGDGDGGEDELAHESHCHTNAEFGMHAGISPHGLYHGGVNTEHGGESMAHNATHVPGKGGSRGKGRNKLGASYDVG